MKIALIATADILTLLSNFKKKNIDFLMPNNIYNPKILVGSKSILMNGFIKSILAGENKEIFSYKTQGLFKIYSYYYKVSSNFRKINLTKKEYIELQKNYDKILLSIPNDFIFKTKTSGIYFYNIIKEDKELKSRVIFYSSFINKVASFSNGKLISNYYLEPIKKSIKILVPQKTEIKQDLPNKIRILNLIRDNDIIVQRYREEIND